MTGRFFASIKRRLTSFHLPFLQLHFFLHPSLPPSPSPSPPCRPGCSGALVVAVAAAGRAATRERVTTRRSVTKIIPGNWIHRLTNKHPDLSCDLYTLDPYSTFQCVEATTKTEAIITESF